ncbi:MAG TPA: hypothetical protein VHS08_04190 [Candidatus Acidoferrales bacterium]|jgi:hypothetical protein|nr:hypothetical protein [Candidatus Acidoferrales bacterium]
MLKTLTPITKVKKTTSAAAMPAVPLEEVFSFLKETRGIVSWTIAEIANALKIGETEAKRVVRILELQGYVKQQNDSGDTNEWLTTLSGETVSGSAAPRFTLDRVKEGLAALAERIKAINRDRRARLHVTRAVAFGDFLCARARVQAADVGVRIESKPHAGKSQNSSHIESEFLKQLKAGSSLVHVRIYKPWMSKRSHVRLV